ncbi:TolC family protein [Propionivibrio dicarboxylicus]|uniref:Outer membrane protein, cobalt-zinc-cadmium efflux system n=1 Tax=Propionivibrio dicarboxylicus TaxID=83767 RepID=A0A1G8E1X0_9RHOO|nr:TolC family protein [Propionivibrio dicarboxylicus]SDH63926.1 outer membrane protein, cobalt-zinc-cadmium efflux system [Propionivibrio dicarboxylicus]
MFFSKRLFFSVLALPACLAMAAAPAAEPPAGASYSLDQLITLTLEHNRGLRAAGDLVDAARAGIDSAQAFPNPEVETVHGSVRMRQPGVTEGDSRAIWVSQRIDYPWLRSARIGAADAGFDAARAEARHTRNELLARLRYRFYELLRYEAELKAAHDDETTIEQIAHRIQIKVDTGESPRFEAIKAETELLSARKMVQSAELRLHQARATLRQLVGTSLPHNFRVAGTLDDKVAVPPLETLLAEVQERNPDLARQRALTRQAENLRDHERRLRWPALTVRGGYDQTPDTRDNRIGVVLTLPLWDRRSGPVAEAEARLSRARNEEAQQEFTLQQNLEVAWQQWQIAASQVQALQSGILRQAEAALRIAEAAYRYGERGILDYLDAQRVYRAARNELIAARFDQQVASLEIDRLRATLAQSSPTAEP